MKKYTANYAFTNPNFVVQNLVENEANIQDKALLFVLNNILQRGFPTILSEYLQEKLGRTHLEEDFMKPSFLFISPNPPKWINTIKGDELKEFPPSKILIEGKIIESHYPAKVFFEELIPIYFGEYSFIQSLLLPEVKINEIVGENNPSFVNQQVDFYFPKAQLIIEIDGLHHDLDPIIKALDASRDHCLISKGYKVVRITTNELKNGGYKHKIEDIINYLKTERISKSLALYKESFELIKNGELDELILKRKILPTAIMRFQILLIDFLLNQYISFDDNWNFNFIIRKNERLEGFAELALEDFFIWFEQLYKLKHKEEFRRPNYQVNYAYTIDDYNTSSNVVNIDFSLFERWTDENILHPDLIIVRTDYFGAEKNYFKVSCTTPIKYNITSDDKPTLEFFLKNIFEKASFREGQFPIISNVLNREDTIGLLPTGGGKSMCYQLPCLLQPSISFVVCPIKSLMYDQKLNMEASCVTNTNSITSDLTPQERSKIQNEFAQGKYLFIWISPERFQKKDFREYIADVYANPELSISYAVIDEVHCMSEWGHDFRTSYLNLTKTIQRYCPSSKFIGLTATASVNVLKDIKVEFSRNERKLGDENIKSLLDYSRKELVFQIIVDQNNKYNKLKEIIESENIIEDDNNACLIFTPHVNGSYGCYSVANNIDRISTGKTKWYSGEVPEIPEYDDSGNNTGRKVAVMSEDEFKKYKVAVQANFKKDKFPVLVATKAFGMGIDKNNINYTIHYGIPSSVEALYQEAGRAGRWTNKDKKAKCYVLYSQETTDEENIKKLFEIDTTFAEIKAINEEVEWNGGDIFRQLFLFLQGQRDINEDFKAIKLITENYFKPKSKQKIWFSTVSRELRSIGFSGSNESLKEIAQKAIYRLRILGIVVDWTTDFVNHFEVEFGTIEERNIYNCLLNFISKYQADINLIEELNQINQRTVFDKSIWYLLKWTFENIAYNRKQSLKTLADWCDAFETEGNEKFKQRIDNYFRFTDTTFIFQHIGENPREFEKWFEVFYVGRDLIENEEGIYIPNISDEKIRQEEFERLRDSLSRFLESNKDNVGLNIISGLIRLSLGSYENQDGKERFEVGLSFIKDRFEKLDQLEIIEKLKKFGNNLSEENKENLCFSIVKFYPNLLEELADYYGLFYLLDDTISKKVSQLKNLNTKLYEEFEQIGTL